MYLPSAKCRSLWHTPAAAVCTSTSCGPGLSMVTSSISSWPGMVLRTAAFMGPPRQVVAAVSLAGSPDLRHGPEMVRCASEGAARRLAAGWLSVGYGYEATSSSLVALRGECSNFQKGSASGNRGSEVVQLREGIRLHLPRWRA